MGVILLEKKAVQGFIETRQHYREDVEIYCPILGFEDSTVGLITNIIFWVIE